MLSPCSADWRKWFWKQRCVEMWKFHLGIRPSRTIAQNKLRWYNTNMCQKSTIMIMRHGQKRRCKTLQYTGTPCNTQQRITTSCHIKWVTSRLFVLLQHTATTTTHCNTLQHTVSSESHIAAATVRVAATYCNNWNTLHQVSHIEWVMLRLLLSLQYAATTATHCNTLKHTATSESHCGYSSHNNTLQQLLHMLLPMYQYMTAYSIYIYFAS